MATALVQVLYFGRSEDQRNATTVNDIFSTFHTSEEPAAAASVATTSAE